MGNCLCSKLSRERPDKLPNKCSKKSKNLKNKQRKTENSEENEGMENISGSSNNKEKTVRKMDDINSESFDDGMKGNRDETRESVKVPDEVAVRPCDENERMENISGSSNNKEKTERKMDDINSESLDDEMKGNRDETRESVKGPDEVAVRPCYENERMENISGSINNKEKTERKMDDINSESLDDGVKGNRDETRESVKGPDEAAVRPCYENERMENISGSINNKEKTERKMDDINSESLDDGVKAKEDIMIKEATECVDNILSSSIVIVYDLVTLVEYSVIEYYFNFKFEQYLWKPFGFSNPKGYCYLNSVIQILVSCNDFYQEFNMLKSLDTLEKNDDLIFVKGLFDLICSLKKENKQGVKVALKCIQDYVTESSSGDDVYKCFMNILTRVSNVIQKSTSIYKQPVKTSSKVNSKADIHFEKFRNKNPGFVFDNFYGLLSFQIKCKVCNHKCNESFQMIKSLPLPVPKSKETVKLETCIELFFNDSDIETDDPMKCECEIPSTNLKSYTMFSRCPKYLFVYLNRGSYYQHGDKNRTNVTCENIINITTSDGNTNEYKLISVIDHMGSSEGGHYYCKCSFETKKWWLLNDTQVTELDNDKKIVTANTIVFMFRRLC